MRASARQAGCMDEHAHAGISASPRQSLSHAQPTTQGEYPPSTAVNARRPRTPGPSLLLPGTGLGGSRRRVRGVRRLDQFAELFVPGQRRMYVHRPSLRAFLLSFCTFRVAHFRVLADRRLLLRFILALVEHRDGFAKVTLNFCYDFFFHCSVEVLLHNVAAGQDERIGIVKPSREIAPYSLRPVTYCPGRR